VKAAAIALTLTLAAAGTASPADLKLELRGGKVTLEARDVTIRQILAEWARVGQTRILNIERVSSGPVTLQFTAVPESEALEIILRQVAGYVAAPRPAGAPGASSYDRILILATSSPVQTSRTPSAPAAGRMNAGVPARSGLPGLGSPEMAPPEMMDLDDDIDEPQPQPARPPARPGASQPGMFVQPPAAGNPADAPASPLQAPTGPAGTPSTGAAGAVLPGIIMDAPRPAAQPTPGTRPPAPDR
jgi:hypothetical protein